MIEAQYKDFTMSKCQTEYIYLRRQIVVVTSEGVVVSLHNTGNLHQVAGEGCAALDQEGGCWTNLRLAIRFYAIPHKQENPVLAIKRFLQIYLL